MHPFDVVDEFERVVADYAGAPYGVAVDSCTNALFLSLVLWRITQGVSEFLLPCKTYVGVAHAVVNAGHKIRFRDYSWEGAYSIGGIIDSARRFRRNMYTPETHPLYCLSFHWDKHLKIGRGGMILLDNKEDYEWLKRVRFDGRRSGVPATEDTFDVPGYHCTMEIDQAIRGLRLMAKMPDYNEDLPMDDYADLSKHEYFTEANR